MLEPVRHNTHNREAWLLTFAILGVLSSALFLFARFVELQTGYSLSMPVAAKVDPTVLVAELQPTAVEVAPTVLGTSANNCVDTEGYKQLVGKLRPELVLYVGTTPYELAMKEIIGCATFSETTHVNANGCNEIVSSFNHSCVAEAISKTSFFEPKEVVISPDRKISTQVRIADESTDREQLPTKMIEAINASLVYDTLTSPYVTIKQIVMQVPVTKSLPSSDGLFARRYVEVDGSRQLIFIWDNGKYRTFRMSGAFLEYNPVGVHRIINKSRLAWSSTASKWMPYWMAFTFDKNQRAWLGFHSLVYWYPGYKQTGEKKIYEPITNIGKPRSTGCLRMSEKDSKALYDWARVDDWVVVHN